MGACGCVRVWERVCVCVSVGAFVCVGASVCVRVLARVWLAGMCVIVWRV